jgi:hypothetical protein
MEGVMPRYVVLDVDWVDDYAVTFGNHTGQEVDRFHTLDCARVLAVQRASNGYWGTIVVDTETNECVFSAADAETEKADGDPASGTREKDEPGEPAQRACIKSSA